MSSQPTSYAVLYDPITKQYVKMDGKVPFPEVEPLKHLLGGASRQFTEVKVVLEDSTGARAEHTFFSGWNNGSQPRSTDLVTRFNDFNSFFWNFVDSPRSVLQGASAITAPLDFKATLQFQGVTGQLDVALDWSNKILEGKGGVQAALESSVNLGQSILNGVVTSPYAIQAGLGAGLFLTTVGAPAAVITGGMVLAGGLTGTLLSAGLGYAESGLLKQATGYDDFGAYAIDEAYKTARDFGQTANSTLKIAGKNINEIFAQKDNTGKVEVTGNGFKATIDPVTGRMTFYTGTEQTRNDFDNAANMEKLIKSIDNSNPGLSEKVTSISLENTVTNAKKEYNRISKELETQLKEKLGNSSNLDNLTPVQQTEQAKYYSPSQLPSLTTNGREHLDYLRGDMRTKLDAAKAEGKLLFARKLNSLDDLVSIYKKCYQSLITTDFLVYIV